MKEIQFGKTANWFQIKQKSSKLNRSSLWGHPSLTKTMFKKIEPHRHIENMALIYRTRLHLASEGLIGVSPFLHYYKTKKTRHALSLLYI